MATTIDGSNSVTINSGSVLGITSGTAQASTSGTSIDFTSIPSWVKRITVMFSGVSTSGTSNPLIQLGAGSVTTSGYVSQSAGMTTTVGTTSYTTGFGVRQASAAAAMNGSITLSLLGSNIWVAQGTLNPANAEVYTVSGAVTLSGTLDRVRITTVNGTDTFDAGSINILYE